MNTTNYIRIFRGDDSDALGYQTIVGTIKTDIDLAGCKAVFRFLGFYAEFDPIPEDKKLTIVIPAQASRGFPPGVGYASLKVIDAYGKIRTFTNRIPVIVDTMTPSCGCGEFEVSFSPFPELEPLKIFIGPNAEDFDQYTGFVSKIIDRASLVKYGLAMLADAMSEDGGASGKAASPLAVKAAYDAIIKELVDNYYTAEQTEEAIDRVAAYYITYTAAGAAFPTYSALSNATTVYSGGKVRIPTRNDYCVVLADETHGGAEYRYIYAVAEGETTGSWQPQFPVEGVMTVDQTVQKNSQNPVSGGGVWSVIWGALAALPTGFSSLYDWCVAQLAGKATTADATLTERGPNKDGFSAWTVVCNDTSVHAFVEYVPGGNYYKFLSVNNPEFLFGQTDPIYPNDTATSLAFSDEDAGLVFTATRTALQGYQLGSQTTKPVASEAEAEALRTGKLDKSDVVAPSSSATAGQAADAKATGDALGLIAPDWVQTSAYSAYDCVKYNGAYYYAKQDIAANTAWNANNWGSLANLAAVVKKFLPLAGGEISGDLIVDGQVDISQFFSISKLLSAGLVFIGRINNVERKALLPLSKVFNSPGFTIAFLQDLAPDYDATSTYELNNLCVHGVRLYRCTTAISTAEAWTPAHWAEATVEDVLAALRTAIAAKQDALSQAQLDNIAAVPNKANASDIPYDLVTKTISNNTVALDDRASNSVTISATLSPNTLTINFPTATSGKVRDFAMRLNIAAGVTAPEIAWPQGVTLENNGGEVPEIADGGTGGSSTILYFSETENNGTTAKFLVKGETLTAIAQA